jgi:hypothetical protein
MGELPVAGARAQRIDIEAHRWPSCVFSLQHDTRSRGSPEAVCATFNGISGFERECFGNIASLGAVLRSSCLSRRRPKCAAERRIGAVQGSIGAKALFDDEELTQIKGQRAARLRAGPTRFSRAAAHLTSFQ